MLLAPALQMAPRVIAERIGVELARLLERRPGADRGRRPGVRQPGPVRRLAPARAGRRCSPRGRGSGPAERRPGRARADRVRLGQPDRTAGGGQRPARRLRRLAGPDPRPPRPSGCARVLLQRRRQPDPAARRVGAARGRAGRRCPRAATRATTWPSWRRRSPGAESRPASELAAEAVGDAAGADQGDARALPRPLRQLLQRADAARRLPERPRLARWRCWRSAATCTGPRARPGCGRRRSATTRTGW